MWVKSYTVQPGDSWSRIAGSVYGNQRYFAMLASYNGGVDLHPGMVIDIPDLLGIEPGSTPQEPNVPPGALQYYSPANWNASQAPPIYNNPNFPLEQEIKDAQATQPIQPGPMQWTPQQAQVQQPPRRVQPPGRRGGRRGAGPVTPAPPRPPIYGPSYTPPSPGGGGGGNWGTGLNLPNYGQGWYPQELPGPVAPVPSVAPTPPEFPQEAFETMQGLMRQVWVPPLYTGRGFVPGGWIDPEAASPATQIIVKLNGYNVAYHNWLQQTIGAQDIWGMYDLVTSPNAPPEWAVPQETWDQTSGARVLLGGMIWTEAQLGEGVAAFFRTSMAFFNWSQKLIETAVTVPLMMGYNNPAEYWTDFILHNQKYQPVSRNGVMGYWFHSAVGNEWEFVPESEVNEWRVNNYKELEATLMGDTRQVGGQWGPAKSGWALLRELQFESQVIRPDGTINWFAIFGDPLGRQTTFTPKEAAPGLGHTTQRYSYEWSDNMAEAIANSQGLGGLGASYLLNDDRWKKFIELVESGASMRDAMNETENIGVELVLAIFGDPWGIFGVSRLGKAGQVLDRGMAAIATLGLSEIAGPITESIFTPMLKLNAGATRLLVRETLEERDALGAAVFGLSKQSKVSTWSQHLIDATNMISGLYKKFEGYDVEAFWQRVLLEASDPTQERLILKTEYLPMSRILKIEDGVASLVDTLDSLEVEKVLKHYGAFRNMRAETRDLLIEGILRETDDAQATGYYLAQAMTDQYAKELGIEYIRATSFRNSIEYLQRLAKELWLGFSIPYNINNYTDNIVKTLVTNYMPTFSPNAYVRITEMLMDTYGIRPPENVVQSLVKEILGDIDRVGATEMLPYPIGRVQSIPNLIDKVVGHPSGLTRSINDWLTEHNALIKNINRFSAAGLMNKFFHVSAIIEKSARANIFYQSLKIIMDEVGGPGVVKYIDSLPPDLHLGGLARGIENKSITSLDDIEEWFARQFGNAPGGWVPETFWGDMRPANAPDNGVMRNLSRELNGRQQQILATRAVPAITPAGAQRPVTERAAMATWVVEKFDEYETAVITTRDAAIRSILESSETGTDTLARAATDAGIRADPAINPELAAAQQMQDIQRESEQITNQIQLEYDVREAERLRAQQAAEAAPMPTEEEILAMEQAAAPPMSVKAWLDAHPVSAGKDAYDLIENLQVAKTMGLGLEGTEQAGQFLGEWRRIFRGIEDAFTRLPFQGVTPETINSWVEMAELFDNNPQLRTLWESVSGAWTDFSPDVFRSIKTPTAAQIESAFQGLDLLGTYIGTMDEVTPILRNARRPTVNEMIFEWQSYSVLGHPVGQGADFWEHVIPTAADLQQMEAKMAGEIAFQEQELARFEEYLAKLDPSMTFNFEATKRSYEGAIAKTRNQIEFMRHLGTIAPGPQRIAAIDSFMRSQGNMGVLDWMHLRNEARKYYTEIVINTWVKDYYTDYVFLDAAEAAMLGGAESVSHTRGIVTRLQGFYGDTDVWMRAMTREEVAAANSTALSAAEAAARAGQDNVIVFDQINGRFGFGSNFVDAFLDATKVSPGDDPSSLIQKIADLESGPLTVNDVPLHWQVYTPEKLSQLTGVNVDNLGDKLFMVGANPGYADVRALIDAGVDPGTPFFDIDKLTSVQADPSSARFPNLRTVMQQDIAAQWAPGYVYFFPDPAGVQMTLDLSPHYDELFNGKELNFNYNASEYALVVGKGGFDPLADKFKKASFMDDWTALYFSADRKFVEASVSNGETLRGVALMLEELGFNDMIIKDGDGIEHTLQALAGQAPDLNIGSEVGKFPDLLKKYSPPRGLTAHEMTWDDMERFYFDELNRVGGAHDFMDWPQDTDLASIQKWMQINPSVEYHQSNIINHVYHGGAGYDILKGVWMDGNTINWSLNIHDAHGYNVRAYMTALAPDYWEVEAATYVTEQQLAGVLPLLRSQGVPLDTRVRIWGGDGSDLDVTHTLGEWLGLTSPTVRPLKVKRIPPEAGIVVQGVGEMGEPWKTTLPHAIAETESLRGGVNSKGQWTWKFARLDDVDADNVMFFRSEGPGNIQIEFRPDYANNLAFQNNVFKKLSWYGLMGDTPITMRTLGVDGKYYDQMQTIDQWITGITAEQKRLVRTKPRELLPETKGLARLKLMNLLNGLESAKTVSGQPGILGGVFDPVSKRFMWDVQPGLAFSHNEIWDLLRPGQPRGLAGTWVRNGSGLHIGVSSIEHAQEMIGIFRREGRFMIDNCPISITLTSEATPEAIAAWPWQGRGTWEGTIGTFINDTKILGTPPPAVPRDAAGAMAKQFTPAEVAEHNADQIAQMMENPDIAAIVLDKQTGMIGVGYEHAEAASHLGLVDEGVELLWDRDKKAMAGGARFFQYNRTDGVLYSLEYYDSTGLGRLAAEDLKPFLGHLPDDTRIVVIGEDTVDEVGEILQEGGRKELGTLREVAGAETTFELFTREEIVKWNEDQIDLAKNDWDSAIIMDVDTGRIAVAQFHEDAAEKLGLTVNYPNARMFVYRRAPTGPSSLYYISPTAPTAKELTPFRGLIGDDTRIMWNDQTAGEMRDMGSLWELSGAGVEHKLMEARRNKPIEVTPPAAEEPIPTVPAAPRGSQAFDYENGKAVIYEEYLDEGMGALKYLPPETEVIMRTADRDVPMGTVGELVPPQVTGVEPMPPPPGNIAMNMQEQAQLDWRTAEIGKVNTESAQMLDSLNTWKQSVLQDVTSGGGMGGSTGGWFRSQKEWESGRIAVTEIKKRYMDALDKAVYQSIGKTNSVLFDYVAKGDTEQLLRAFAPFTTWQIRNPMFWAQIFARRPGVLSQAVRFLEASERQRQRYGLTDRFRKTFGFNLPSDIGPIPAGYYGFNMTPLVSLFNQFRPPFEVPDAYPQTDSEFVNYMRKLLQYGRSAGLNLWPWINYPLELAGLVPKGSTQWSAGPIQRLIELGLQQSGILPPGQGLFGANPVSQFLNTQNIERELAAMEKEGLITHDQATAALAGQSPDVLAQVQERVLRQQGIAQAWSLVSPFTMKYASPGEAGIRQDKLARTEMLETARGMYPMGGAEGHRLEDWIYGHFPELETYGLAMTDDPRRLEIAMLYNKYDTLLADLMPWTPEYKQLIAQRAAEMEQLFGVQDDPAVLMQEYMTRGLEPQSFDYETNTWRDVTDAERHDLVLSRLEDVQPRASQFMDENGVIDWEKYDAEWDIFLDNIPGISKQFGYEVTYEDFIKWHYRAAAPEKVAYDMYKDFRSKNWDTYYALKPSIEPGGQYWDEMVTSTAEAERLRDLDRGFTPYEADQRYAYNLNKYITEGEIPYEYYLEWRQKILDPYIIDEKINLNTFTFQVAETLGIDIKNDPTEYIRLMNQLNYELPGMVTPDAYDNARELLNTYFYDQLTPQEQQDVAGYFGFWGIPKDDSAMFAMYTRLMYELNPNSRYGGVAGDVPPSVYLPPMDSTLSPEELAEIDQAMVERYRYYTARNAGVGGTWTPLMDKYYGDENSPQTQFWTFLENVSLSANAFSDPVLSQIMSRSARTTLQYTDDQWRAALQYLKDNYDNLIDAEMTQKIVDHPDWWMTAQQQRAEYDRFKDLDMEVLKSQYYGIAYANRKEWTEANPEEWKQLEAYLAREKARAFQYPYYMYWFKQSDYKKYFGSTTPDKITGGQKIADDFAQAIKDMDAYINGSGTWTDLMQTFYGPPPAPPQP